MIIDVGSSFRMSDVELLQRKVLKFVDRGFCHLILNIQQLPQKVDLVTAFMPVILQVQRIGGDLVFVNPSDSSRDKQQLFDLTFFFETENSINDAISFFVEGRTCPICHHKFTKQIIQEARNSIEDWEFVCCECGNVLKLDEAGRIIVV